MHIFERASPILQYPGAHTPLDVDQVLPPRTERQGCDFVVAHECTPIHHTGDHGSATHQPPNIGLEPVVVPVLDKGLIKSASIQGGIVDSSGR